MTESDIIKSICVIVTIMFLFGLIAINSKQKPIFKYTCSQCGKKDRNWRWVPIGHDDFVWEHNCKN